MPGVEPASRQLAAVDLAELLSMPLTALIEADVQASKAFLDFLYSFGFDHAEGDAGSGSYGRLRTISFNYQRVGTDGQQRTFTIELPVILLVPLPTLSVEKANVSFDLQVFGMIERSAEQMDALDQLPSRHAPVSRRKLQMKARIARAPRNAAPPQTVTSDQVSTKFEMKVDLVMTQSDLPEGILQLLNLTAQSTQDSETNTPSIQLTPLDGNTTFTAVGEQRRVGIQIIAAENTDLSKKTVFLAIDGNSIDHRTRVTTSDTGYAETVLTLDAVPRPRRSLRVLGARTRLDTQQFGSTTAEGGIDIIVDVRAPS